MTEQDVGQRFRTVGDASGLSQEDIFYREEVLLAFRNRGMPLEALSYPITPTTTLSSSAEPAWHESNRSVAPDPSGHSLKLESSLGQPGDAR